MFLLFTKIVFSDSWERVSVGECAGEDISAKLEGHEEKISSQPANSRPGEDDLSLEGSSLTVGEPVKERVNVERIFRYNV